MVSAIINLKNPSPATIHEQKAEKAEKAAHKSHLNSIN